MLTRDNASTIAVVGAGIAGAACAAALRQAGYPVMMFDKSRGVGGRMATRRAQWIGADGAEHPVEFDHGAPDFIARRPRLRAVVAQAQAAGVVAPWRKSIHAPWPATAWRERFVAVPSMPALCRHLVGDLPLRLDHTVQRLHRSSAGWQLALAGGATLGSFAQVMLAMPPAQAALLLAGHADAWADSLAAVRLAPCWTLMAVTDDVDWPWDEVRPERGPLASLSRNDRKPGRSATPGHAVWVAHATPAWSEANLEEEPAAVASALRDAMQTLLPGGRVQSFHHASAHRWRYAAPAGDALGGSDCLWDARLGIGVCGDWFGAGDVESAWCSGDELADEVAASLEGGQTLWPADTGFAVDDDDSCDPSLTASAPAAG